MRHTSGITDCQDLLEAEGIGVTDPAGQKEAIGAVLASQPEEPPGTRFSYSYNYRTGRIGGKQLLAGLTDGAVSVGDTLRGRGIEEGRYGAGMLVLPDKSLVHRGGRGSTAPSRSARTAAPPSPSCATWIRPITSVRRTGCWTSGPDDARRGSRCGRAPETGPGA
ncbi:hypothetical protein ACWGF3_12045 [Streptomyces xanthophaeus]|uniref:Uncharacterized protein n=1 Tax=Streptomyces xanthophaeus TaxID=67385 RepID=A0A919GSR5_9ACTN|nr:hypothetical protein [Streptomyces xanthophaeus]GHI82889.1 hypothetical protein Sxan_02530 [Streptomyces xanthophaeus]